MDARDDPVPVLNLQHWTDGTPAQRAQLLDDVRVTCAEVSVRLYPIRRQLAWALCGNEPAHAMCSGC